MYENIQIQLMEMNILCTSIKVKSKHLQKHIFQVISPLGEWADPGGTAIPGQPVEKLEQAPKSSPKSKNQFNIEVPHWGTYQILS